MDASIIDGFKMECGSVATVSNVEHPISLARYVLNNFPNSIVVGEGAQNLAEHAKSNLLPKNNMTAPMAHLAYKFNGNLTGDPNWNTESYQHAEILKSTL